MKTGEGKTLVSTLPVYLNGLTGKGVHVITVNDYLAKRDAEWMGAGPPLARARPSASSCPTLTILGGEARRLRRATSPTASTTSSASTTCATTWPCRPSDKVQRGHAYAIVDEVDSILIDEARTPLIISGRVADAAKLYYKFASIVRGLAARRRLRRRRGEAPRRPHRGRGSRRSSRPSASRTSTTSCSQNLVHQLQAALRAKELYKRDKDYIVTDGEVKIVDEFTGRILEGRRWSEGLHQAVEAKEGVRIKEENQTLATITLQNYFRLYDKLAGMTGTADHRGGRVRRHLRPGRWCRSRPTSRWSAPTRATSSTRPRTPSSTRWSTTSPSATRRASPCSSAPCRSRSPSACRAC